MKYKYTYRNTAGELWQPSVMLSAPNIREILCVFGIPH